ncbi:hypothetical protein RA269_27855, partial [Pseudomonas syringae pv. tagetis]|uniref:hypothetical protein n=1 Tax=Pseudomonas syringae group genomosp. 7 TaxID=251699 RepID=UPI00377020E5
MVLGDVLWCVVVGVLVVGGLGGLVCGVCVLFFWWVLCVGCWVFVCGGGFLVWLFVICFLYVSWCCGPVGVGFAVCGGGGCFCVWVWWVVVGGVCLGVGWGG